MGNKEIEDALGRLRGLTSEQTQLCATQSLAAVYGLFGYMEAEMEGTRLSTLRASHTYCRADIKASADDVKDALASITQS